MSVLVSVERLRVWLLAGAVLLVLVIAAFLGYAHYRAHRFLTELPTKLGADIRQETNAFTYSQSVQGRTVYTIHAAKAIQRKDGKVTLHDVGIVLYGHGQGQSDRMDRIYGKEFEYDQNAGVIRATGEVHLDLEAPMAADAKGKMDYAAGSGFGGYGDDAHKTKDERLIHVKTSGLVFLQKLGVAATDQEIEFEYGGLTGHATGADYSSDTGVLVLHSAVKANGLQGGRPAVLTASRGEMDRVNQKVVLSQAKYMSVGGAGGAAQTVTAERAIAYLRKDGSAERVEGDGGVTVAEGDGGTVVAPRGDVVLNAANQPESARLFGGVRYVADGPLSQARGEMAEGRATFDKKGRPEHVVLDGAVHLNERVRNVDAASEPWSLRELEAGKVELVLAAEGAGKARLQDAKATENARLKVVNPSGKTGTKGMMSSALAGDVLTAHFVRVDGVDHLAEVHGDGHTQLRRVRATGVVNTSSGDILDVHFKMTPRDTEPRKDQVARSRQGSKTDTAQKESDEISTASEEGHVVLTQRPVQRPGDSAQPEEERVTAQRAVYDAELERMTLTGNVQMTDGASVLWADQVVTEQPTGDATADGSVQASYFQQKGGDAAREEPVHVLASRAEMKHDAQTAIFYGAAGRPARLWQGASQVEAPVLQFEQKLKRLLARGEGQGAPMAVHTVLVSGGPGKNEAGKAPTGKADGVKAGLGSGKMDVVRVSSREMTYSDNARKAEFTGGVRVESVDGSMRGQQAVVYLQGAPTSGGRKLESTGGKLTTAQSGSGGTEAGGQSAFLGGSVERVVATGHIEIEQPGRRATGEQVVYTASDGMFVLTGTATAVPKVVDEQRGTVTGTSLRFHSGDESVVISNGVNSSAGQRVRTETRVKK